ncbi:hypothetical protein QAD02_014496 [Eretmocerus hayati]|uniref:Uncharacterized protein n=1 Tax=Eretmocerus hayati TaxID=131215 RepID=A0ACC2P7X6_9HYME|nr:hypothetical protein QAD02_014496 [Eretmocerus hayati]
MRRNPRLLIANKISQALSDKNVSVTDTVAKHLTLNLGKSDGTIYFSLPLRSKFYDIRADAPKLINSKSDEFLENVIPSDNSEKLHFIVHREHFIKGLLDSLYHKVVPPDFLCRKQENIVVEFSSPNIAKPFHIGHLRSTIIGNCIANIHNFMNCDVRKINYLGDWGTQFGFVQLGLSLIPSSNVSLQNDPIHTLYNAYVQASAKAEKDPTLADKARNIFESMEKGDEDALSQWTSIREHTIEELKNTYSRLNVNFDEYEWESMYRMEKISGLISELERQRIVKVDSEGKKIIVLSDKKSVPIVKSDGSSLYISRDIAAAMERYKKFKFDRMYYVVDNGQTQHFMNLINILELMKLPWANKLMHIKFGKVRGMSTRKGTAIFLKDILDETRNVMKEKQIQSPNTKVQLDCEHPSTEILGLSAVVINDLKYRRTQDYQFDWNKALDIKGDTGVKLQYTHSRLKSIETYSEVVAATECDPSLLTGSIVDDLTHMIGKFDEAIMNSHQELEPNILVNYLFKLSHVLGSAIKCLKVKGEPMSVASQRLYLFIVARNILAKGMQLVGLTPLDQM